MPWTARVRSLVGAFLAAALLVGCGLGSRAPAGPAPSRAAAGARAADATPDDTALVARLQEVMAAHPVSGALGVSVTDRDGRALLSQHDDVAMIPASTAKLVTAAAALRSLSPGFRYRTRIAATAAPAPDGTVAGDLVLVGSGDPALTTPLFGEKVAPQRPRTPLEALADQVAAAGVRHVTGRLLGDSTVLPDEPIAPGWTERYLDELDTGRVVGLSIDAGRHLFYDGAALRATPSPDPAAEAAAALAALLAERGVTVSGGTASTRTPPPTVRELGAVDSPPLPELLRHMVRHSDNSMADAIFRTLGRQRGGDGSWMASALFTVDRLAELRLDWSGVVVVDGSGLSRDNRMPARFLATLDARMDRSEHREEWAALMAVAGESGTLRRRMVGTPAAHRLRAKTGTLRGVRSLVGSVVGADGRRFHLAVIGNDLNWEGVQATRALTDALATALAERPPRARSATPHPGGISPSAERDPPSRRDQPERGARPPIPEGSARARSATPHPGGISPERGARPPIPEGSAPSAERDPPRRRDQPERGARPSTPEGSARARSATLHPG